MNNADELQDFIERRTTFERGALTALEELYTAYLDHCGYDGGEAARGEVLSRHRFIRLVLKNCGGDVSMKVARMGDRAARCFSGLKLRTFEDLAQQKAAPDGVN
jgi:hypothetical protein